MKNLVLYCSITGGTAKIAKAIAQELNCDLINLRKNSISNINFYEIENLFVGSGVYGGKLHGNMMALTKNEDFIEAIIKNIKTLGLFSTYAGTSESSQKAIADFKRALPKDIQSKLTEFYCKGTLFKIFGRGRPIAEDVEKGKSWAKEILSE